MQVLVFAIPITMLAALSAWTWALCDSLREERSYTWLVLLLFFPPIVIPAYLINFVLMDDPLGKYLERRSLVKEAEQLEVQANESNILGEWQRLGEIYYKLGEWEKCLAALKNVFDQDPETLRGQYQAAVSLMNLNKPEKALVHLEYVADEQPDFQTWHVQVVLGKLYDMLGRSEDAMAAFDLCLSHIRDVDAILEKAWLNTRLGNTEEAEAAVAGFIREVEADVKNTPKQERDMLPKAKSLLQRIRTGDRS